MDQKAEENKTAKEILDACSFHLTKQEASTSTKQNYNTCHVKTNDLNGLAESCAVLMNECDGVRICVSDLELWKMAVFKYLKLIKITVAMNTRRAILKALQKHTGKVVKYTKDTLEVHSNTGFNRLSWINTSKVLKVFECDILFLNSAANDSPFVTETVAPWLLLKHSVLVSFGS